MTARADTQTRGAARGAARAAAPVPAASKGATGSGGEVRTLVRQVLAPQMLYQMAFFALLPAFVGLIIERACEHERAAAGDAALPCTETAVSKRSATWYNYLVGMLNIAALVACIAVGAKSDRIGRKKPFLFTVACLVVSAAAMWACAAFEFDIFLLLPFLFVGGCGGGLAAFIALCFGTAADVSSSAATLPRNFAWVTSGLFLGGTVAPLLGGVLSTARGVHTTLFAATVLLTLTAAYYALVYQESLPSPKRLTSPFRPARIVCDTLRVVFERDRVRLRLLFWCYNLLYLNITGQYQLIIVYVSAKPFEFSAQQVGFLIALNWLVRSIMLFACPLLLRPLSFGRGAKRGHINMAKLGAALQVLSFVGYGLADSATGIYCLTAFDGIAIMWNTAIRTLFSEEVSASEQGTILSVIALVETFWNLTTPFIFNSIYTGTVDWFRGFAFLCMAACSCVAGALGTQIQAGDGGGTGASTEVGVGGGSAPARGQVAPVLKV